MSYSPYVSLGTYSRDHSCGYCGQDDTAQSFGFVAPLMNAEVYEAMLSQGWRRSGRYMYKHNLKHTCCRLYPIRLEAKCFKAKREHRKDVNRFNRYIKGESWDAEVSQYAQRLEIQRTTNSSSTSSKSKRNNEFDILSVVHAAEYENLIDTQHPEGLKPAHNFTLELDTDRYTLEKYQLYAKYQRVIHHESKHEITPEQFTRFLCSSPLPERAYSDKITGEHRKTGSFHQLYRIDGALVAFAVLDLLPNTISSVYFVYDPDTMGKFGMGKVSAVREVAMCVEGGYKYYGLGLFASGCEKLRYKSELQPSELLDPETFRWHPFEKFRPFFEQGQTYVTLQNTSESQNQSDLADHQSTLQPVPFFSILDQDQFLFTHGPTEEPPYDPHPDNVRSQLFQADMPAVHARDMIINAEGFWGKFIFLRENGELVRYWSSQAAKDDHYREAIREMVAILGSLVFEMIIWIS